MNVKRDWLRKASGRGGGHSSAPSGALVYLSRDQEAEAPASVDFSSGPWPCCKEAGLAAMLFKTWRGGGIGDWGRPKQQ